MTSDLGVTMTTVYGFQSLLGNVTCEDCVTFIGADASYITIIFFAKLSLIFWPQGIKFTINFTDKKSLQLLLQSCNFWNVDKI